MNDNKPLSRKHSSVLANLLVVFIVAVPITLTAEKGTAYLWERLKSRALVEEIAKDAQRIQINIDGKGTIKLDNDVTKEDLIRALVRYDKKLHDRETVLKSIADITKTEL